ncbi:MAG TPA: hypothetical protein VIL36_17165 [Acidimicrobiales bacterium]
MMASLNRVQPTTSAATTAVWFGGAALYIIAMSLGMRSLSYDIWGALVIGPILATLTLPLLRKSVVRDDPTMVNLISAAFVAKMIGACLRYYLTFKLYGDNADAIGYHGGGSRLALAFWEGNFAEMYAEEVPDLMGTEFLRLTTGLLYIVTGPTMLGGFLVYALLSFLGLYWCYRALRTAFPEADHRRYAWLLFFLPSLLYWPSSIGKEAWMLCTIGLATYGVAMILKHNPLGYPVAGFGLAGTAMVRPHVTALIFASLMVSYMLRRKSWAESRTGPIGKMVGVAVLLAAGGVVLSSTASFFEVDGTSTQSVQTVLERTEAQSGQGGSQFDGARPFTPAQFPNAMMAVLFRPYVWEASEPQMLVAALEGSFLLWMCWLSRRSLARVLGLLFRVPYVAYCLAYTTMFIFAFSSIGNFGIMTRQRTQVFPFVLVLLCLPTRRIDEGDDMVDDAYRLGVPRRTRVRVDVPAHAALPPTARFEP